jgi:uncharacterized SAM-binding protein YcdF (DUF218 family)
MFFYLSKILWFFAAPSTLIVGAMTLGTALAFTTRFARVGRRLAGLGALAFLVFGSGPFGGLIVGALERRFPPFVADSGPAPDGVIVLGGAIGEAEVAPGVWQVAMNDGAERMTEGLALARRFPQARFVFTGGKAALIKQDRSESEAARQLWASLGYPVERILFEDQSRNTVENAVNTAALVRPKPGERWLLVTSAHHMPRSIGIFRKAGFDVIAAPVDYRTGFKRIATPREASGGLFLLDLGVREWIGLVAYRLTGKSSAVFPAP